MALAAGGKTQKMKFGHHGANHTVKDLESGRVLITSQNHGFAADPATLPANVKVTHVSLFDGSLQAWLGPTVRRCPSRATRKRALARMTWLICLTVSSASSRKPRSDFLRRAAQRCAPRPVVKETCPSVQTSRAS